MVTLKNNTNRRQIFELTHDVVCTEDHCLCSMAEVRGRVHNPETGEIGERSDEVRVPSSVHLSARGSSSALPDEAVHVPAIADAIRRGLISVG